MLIEYGRYTIRNAESGDADILAGWWNDGEVMEHAGFPEGLGTDPETIRRELSLDSDETRRRLIIEIDGVPAGEMSYRNKGEGIAEIGIKICNPAKRGRGHGSVLIKMLITALFSREYGKIILDTNFKNKRAMHVYEKIGFIQTGVRKNSWKNQLGELQSSVDYELTVDRFTPLEL